MGDDGDIVIVVDSPPARGGSGRWPVGSQQCLRGRRSAVCIDVNIGGRTTTGATAVMTAVDFALI